MHGYHPKLNTRMFLEVTQELATNTPQLTQLLPLTPTAFSDHVEVLLQTAAALPFPSPNEPPKASLCSSFPRSFKTLGQKATLLLLHFLPASNPQSMPNFMAIYLQLPHLHSAPASPPGQYHRTRFAGCTSFEPRIPSCLSRICKVERRKLPCHSSACFNQPVW